MMVWKMIFLFNWVIFRFHVNLPGCTEWDEPPPPKNIQIQPPGLGFPHIHSQHVAGHRGTVSLTGARQTARGHGFLLAAGRFHKVPPLA